MKENSFSFHRAFTHGVYNPDMWTTGGDKLPEHRVTVAGGRQL
jgi:hypothetical protein